MYERTYGAEYDSALTVKEVAAEVRRRLRAAAKTTESPVSGWTAKVRYRTAANCQSIDVYLVAPEGAHVKHRWGHKGDTEARSFVDENNPATVCVVCGVQAIAERSEARRFWWTEAGREAYWAAAHELAKFQHDGSDLMTDYFDVNFYSNVGIYEAGDKVWGAS